MATTSATPASCNARTTSTNWATSRTAPVRRLELGQILEDHAAVGDRGAQVGVAGDDQPVPHPVYPQFEHLPHLIQVRLWVVGIEALLPGVQGDPQTGVAGAGYQGRQIAVGVGWRRAGAPWAADVHTDDPAPGKAHRPLDHGRIEVGAEAAVHHQHDPRPHRILQAGPLEPVDGGQHDRIEVPLATAVAFGRAEAHLVGGDVLGAVGAADHAVHRPQHPLGAALDQFGQPVDPV